MIPVVITLTLELHPARGVLGRLQELLSELPVGCGHCRIGLPVHHRSPPVLAPLHDGVPREPVDDGRAHLLRGPVHEGVLVPDATRVLDQPSEPGVAVVCEVVHRVGDVRCRVQRHHLPRGDYEDIPGVAVAYGHGEPPADHVAQDVVEDHIGLVRADHVQVLELLERGYDAAAGASDPGPRTPALDAHDAVPALEDDVLELGVRIVPHRLQDGGDPPAGDRACRIGLGVASYLYNLQSAAGQGGGDVPDCGRFPDSTFAVDRDSAHVG